MKELCCNEASVYKANVYTGQYIIVRKDVEYISILRVYRHIMK